MKDKFILEIYDDEDNLITSTVYKSYKDICEKTNIEYHNCRTIHSICMGDVQPKYVHKTLKQSKSKTYVQSH